MRQLCEKEKTFSEHVDEEWCALASSSVVTLCQNYQSPSFGQLFHVLGVHFCYPVACSIMLIYGVLYTALSGRGLRALSVC